MFRPRKPRDQDLERRLGDYGRAQRTGKVPDLSRAVLAKIEGTAPQRRAFRKPAFRLGAAAAASALVAVAVVPGARTALLRALGLRTVRLIEIASLPSAPVRAPLSLGRRISPATALHALPYRPLFPAGKPPDQIFVGSAKGPNRIPGGVVSMIFGDARRPHLLVQEFLGRAPGPQVIKGTTRTATVQRLSVHGQPALWLGSVHTMAFVDADGVTRGTSTRLAGRTLVWLHSELTLRIEGSLDKGQAIELAETFH